MVWDDIIIKIELKNEVVEERILRKDEQIQEMLYLIIRSVFVPFLLRILSVCPCLIPVICKESSSYTSSLLLMDAHV